MLTHALEMATLRASALGFPYLY